MFSIFYSINLILRLQTKIYRVKEFSFCPTVEIIYMSFSNKRTRALNKTYCHDIAKPIPI